MTRSRTPVFTLACMLATSLLLHACSDAPETAGDAGRTEAAPPEVAADGTGPDAALQDIAPAANGAEAAPAAADAAATQGPPLGRYVCRQYTTTMGYLTLGEDGVYETGGVRGRYRHDASSGVLDWEGGSYDEWGWEGRYERVTRPAGDGRPDEDIIRLEGDGLKIDCYRMTDG